MKNKISPPEYFDIHCHINFPEYEQDREEVIFSLSESSVWANVVGVDLITSKQSVELAEKNNNLFATIGVHPDDSNLDWDEKTFSSLSGSSKVVAIGECGIDIRNPLEIFPSERKQQKDLFEKQIQFALNVDKPIMIHCRNAYEEVFQILLPYYKEFGDKLRGNMHFFAGDVDIAEKFLDIGFSLSFTGVITFARDYDEVIKYAPLSMIMSETDSPYASPVPQRGRRNNPIYIKEIVKKIAQIRDEDFEDVRKSLVDNAMGYFALMNKVE